jgi:hypothetical protein
MDLAVIKKWFQKKSATAEIPNNKWKFWTTWQGLSITYPIVPINQVPVPWLGASRNYLQSQQQLLEHPTTNAAHLCSGITASLNQGWIVTSWCDFIITTNGDLNTFEWRLPQRLASKYPAPIIEHFDSRIWGEHANLPLTTLKTVVKYNTPWCFAAPPGWGLLVTPLQYFNESRFTNTLGIIDPRQGNQLNAVLLWHEVNRQTLIRAGTPLFQIYPIPLNRPEFSVEESGPKELEFYKNRDFLVSNTFASNREKTQQLYDYYFKSPEN